MEKSHVISLLSAFVLFGCASTNEPITYNHEHSRALNIAHAGGLYTGLSDKEYPKGQMPDLTQSKLFGATYALSGYASPSLGLTNWGGGVLSLVNWAVSAKKHGGRNSVLAWMPVNEAKTEEDAHQKMFEHVQQAVTQTLTSLGADYKLVSVGDTFRSYFIFNDAWGCPRGNYFDTCVIRIKIYEPYTSKAVPQFLPSVDNQSYVFSASNNYKYNRLLIEEGNKSHMPEEKIFSIISKNLPKWAYVFLAPKTVQLENGEKIPFPYLLEDGEPLLFVKPAKS